MLVRSGAKTALDMFTGTTRVAQEFKRLGAEVTTLDVATYSEVLSQCYISTDKNLVDLNELESIIEELNSLPGDPGYFTDTFCVKARFFQPHNGERVDSIRNRLEKDYRNTTLFPILLTSLMDAADKVDSTAGVQMAYIKSWAPRSHKKMELKVPELINGSGHSLRGDACEVVPNLPSFDLAYLDPPYNQHRYFTNYHIWETLVRWDAPEPYGVAMKRSDARSDTTKSVFNKKREMPNALANVIHSVNARVVLLSYNNESWISSEDLCETMKKHGHVKALSFDSKRYVGAQIGIHNPQGKKVGKVSHLRNKEYVIVAGDRTEVDKICLGYDESDTQDFEQGTLFSKQ